MGLTPLGEVFWGLATVSVDVGRAVSGVEDALILLDGAQGEDHIVVHQGQSLACFPVPKDGTVIDFVLGLSEDLDYRVPPVRVGAGVVRNDGGFGFGGKLGVLI